MIKITSICGDGVGKEIMKSTIKILHSLDLNIEFEEAYAGKECLEKIGSVLPEETLKKAKKNDAILFGAVTSVPEQSSSIITLRKELDLYANIRPIRSLPGVKCIKPNINFTIIRENTEGLYTGIETIDDEKATATRVISKKATERIIEFAFKKSRQDNINLVTCAHKANVLKKSDGLFRDIFYQIGTGYPNIKSEDYFIDAMAMYLITRPETFQTIVTSNLYGDILSDEAAGLVGGLGLVPSANIGDKNGLFEPVHGSAPDIAGKNISNPSAMILSAVMMLNYLKENYQAEKLQNALYHVLDERKTITPDLGGKAKTDEMANAIIEKINE